MLEINLAALARNWHLLCARHAGSTPPLPGADGAPAPLAGRQTAAVLKANAYGLGAVEIAARLHAEGCRHFFTAHLMEAVEIRPKVPGALIVVLHGLGPGEEEVFIEHGLAPALATMGEVAAWNAAAMRAGRKLPALLHVDTGMNRTGLAPAEARALAGRQYCSAGLDLRYVMTHLVAADSPGHPANATQAARFAEIAALFPGVPRSLANSSGIFLGEAFASDLARPGAALYGINPTPGEANPMQTVACLRARVMALREVPAGDGVGYDHQWRAPRPSRIATLPIGYADGYHRLLGNRAEVSIGGRLCSVVGRVSMDLVTIDVTDCPEAQIGSWAEVIGPDIPPERLAARAETNAYEILTALGRRFHRVYLNA